jgi:16S rRNA (cytosine967-C5)-methyltransferase
MLATKKENSSSRSIALSILQKILIQGRSFSTARSSADLLSGGDRSLAMELVHGVLRWRWKLEYVLSRLLKKPLKSKDQDVHVLMLMALYELMELSSPEYAAVNEAVHLSKSKGKSWASGLVNGVLRSFIRDRESILSKVSGDEVASFSHPAWIIELLKKDWPEQWQTILQSNNVRPPLWLRVNQLQNDVVTYGKLLDETMASVTNPYAKHALKLERSTDVSLLPGFERGSFSVQDAGAQLAAELLNAKPGERVLDLCAAPGGKTCHLLELEPQMKTLVAVELDEGRMVRVRENLDRLKLNELNSGIILIVGDSAEASEWWDGRLFDRVLVDVPCSSTGVIRRHPDIKSLRREQDLAPLVVTQQKILQQAIQMLAPGGLLLYVTCSVLKQENESQIEKLLSVQDDVSEELIEAKWGVTCSHGRQLLPGENDADGFYYACIRKKVKKT